MTIYSKNRTPSRIYRKIYEEVHGPIPKDEFGRSYEVHHIDGDDTNNNIENLVALPMQEHYDIHYSQGDYGACYLMALKMNVSNDEISRLIALSHKKRIEEGRHQTQLNWTCTYCGKSGRNILTYHAWHGDRCLSNPNITEKVLMDRLKTKNKKSVSHKKAYDKMLKEGTYNRKQQWTCEFCFKSGKNITNYNKYHGSCCLHNPNVSEEVKERRKGWSANNSLAQLKYNKTKPKYIWTCDKCGKTGTGEGNYSQHKKKFCTTLIK